MALVGIVILSQAQPSASSHLFRFKQADYRVGEDVRSAVIAVVRDDPAGALTINYATADGTATAGGDYVPSSGALRFADGQREATFAVPVLEDGIAEDDETVLLTISPVSSRADAIHGGVGGDGSSAALTIVGNDGGAPGRPAPGPTPGQPVISGQPGVSAQPGGPGQPGAPDPPGGPGQPGAAPGSPGAPAGGASPGGGAPTSPDGVVGGDDVTGPDGDESALAERSGGAEKGGRGAGAADEGGGSPVLPLVIGLAAVASAGGGLWWWRRSTELADGGNAAPS